jgi:hypothetical protein
MVDHDVIRNAFGGLVGDEETGLVRRFGVILNACQVEFLVGREVNFINALGASSRGLSEKVLIDASQWSANATFQGIMDSPEWAQLVTPTIKTMADKLDGLVAVINCLGWGKMSDVQLNEATLELKFNVQHSYYVKYWLDRYGKSDRAICYMWTGVAGAIMDLLYGSKVHEFDGEELSCAAMTQGDVCSFRARKIRKKFGL